MLITPSATLRDTSQRPGIQRHSSPPAASALPLQSTCQTRNPFVYSDVHYFQKRSFFFNLVSVRSAAQPLSHTPTRLMTPVPCNFFSVANSDYRVGVELPAVHHLSHPSYCFVLFFLLSLHAAVFNNGTASR